MPIPHNNFFAIFYQCVASAAKYSGSEDWQKAFKIKNFAAVDSIIQTEDLATHVLACAPQKSQNKNFQEKNRWF